jgi:hypothetical protein
VRLKIRIIVIVVIIIIGVIVVVVAVQSSFLIHVAIGGRRAERGWREAI